MRTNLLIGGLIVAGGIMTACSAAPGGEDAQQERASALEAGSVLTPSNLPADTCDTPGTKDFTGGRLPSDCDSVVHQANAPDICVYKFANVSGNIEPSFPNENFAIVATHTMQLGSYTAPISFGQRVGTGWGGAATQSCCGGGGAGHGTQGGGGTGGAIGGASYGSETGVPLLPGGMGGGGQGLGTQTGGGNGSAAVQFVSCGTLQITGSIVANGEAGHAGIGGGAPGGGGGGSGGTILIEAAHVSATASSILSANGGNGGSGFAHPGGVGGSATSAPGSASCGGALDPTTGRTESGGGGGGAAGRIRINVAAGTQPELLGSVSPVPSIGAIATH